MKRLSEIPLKPNDRAAIEAAARVIRALAPVEEIILFGSKARGDDDRESDIDLLVLTTRPLSRAEENRIIEGLIPIGYEHEVFVSPLILPAEEWRNGILSVLPIRREVNEQGIAA